MQVIEQYQGWDIEISGAPGPLEIQVVHPAHDGAPDSGDIRAFFARSVEQARDVIDEMESMDA